MVKTAGCIVRIACELAAHTGKKTHIRKINTQKIGPKRLDAAWHGIGNIALIIDRVYLTLEQIELTVGHHKAKGIQL